MKEDRDYDDIIEFGKTGMNIVGDTEYSPVKQDFSWDKMGGGSTI
jgi:hypothetical protein